MKLLITLFSIIFWSFCGPANAAIGTPSTILTSDNSGPGFTTGTAVATTADAPAGSLIVILVYHYTPAMVFTSITDSAGNPYTEAVGTPSTSGVFGGEIWFSNNTANDLPSGGTITVNGDTFAINAFVISGANGGLDKTNHNETSSAVSTLSTTTGTLSSGSEIVIGVDSLAFGGTETQPTDFTGLGSISTSGSGGGYDIVSTTSSVTYDPSWSSTAAMAIAVATFKATSASTIIYNRNMMEIGN